MARGNSFEDLVVWQKARHFCKGVFEKIGGEPFSPDFALKNQMNRSSGSVMDNIAEGFEREGRQEFIQFLSIAKASPAEVRSQLYRAKDRRYLNDEEFEIKQGEIREISKMISGLMHYLKNSEIKGLKYRL